MGAVTEIEAGRDLIEALSEFDGGWLSATGLVEGVELRVAADGVDPVRALRGRYTLASLLGPAGGPYGVVLGRASELGLAVVAGQLVAARSLGVAVSVSGAGGAATARSAPPRPPPAERASAPSPPPSQWSEAVAAATPEVAPEEEPLWPEAGDLVQHFAFGLCAVLMASDDRLKIRDLNGPGRLREIRAEVLKVYPPTERDGKRLFRLERKN